jgi:hypothetical protein
MVGQRLPVSGAMSGGSRPRKAENGRVCEHWHLFCNILQTTVNALNRSVNNFGQQANGGLCVHG